MSGKILHLIKSTKFAHGIEKREKFTLNFNHKNTNDLILFMPRDEKIIYSCWFIINNSNDSVNMQRNIVWVSVKARVKVISHKIYIIWWLAVIVKKKRP